MDIPDAFSIIFANIQQLPLTIKIFSVVMTLLFFYRMIQEGWRTFILFYVVLGLAVVAVYLEASNGWLIALFAFMGTYGLYVIVPQLIAKLHGDR